MIAEVAPNVYTFDHRVAEGKNVVIFGERGAWAIDTGIDPTEGEEIAAFIRQRGYEANRLILTHGHGDHVLGSTVFRSAEVIAHDLAPLEMRRLLPTLAKRANVTPESLAEQIAWPTLTFDRELRICLDRCFGYQAADDDRQLHLFPTPGHSQDGISIYLATEKLLIAGDSVVTGIVPAIGDGDSRVLERTLHKLAALDIDTLIPGHGSVVYGRAQVQDWLRWLPDYLHRVRLFVQEALPSIPPAEIPARCDYDSFIGERLSKNKHKMERRHQATVAKIVEEELAQRSANGEKDAASR